MCLRSGDVGDPHMFSSRHMAPSPCQYSKKTKGNIQVLSRQFLLSYRIVMLRSSHVVCMVRGKQHVHWYLVAKVAVIRQGIELMYGWVRPPLHLLGFLKWTYTYRLSSCASALKN